jgi:hypothetical protein
VKQRWITAENNNDNVDHVTQVRIQDMEAEEETAFVTPPMTPASTATHVDCSQHTCQPTGEPSIDANQLEDVDLQGFFNELT